MALDKGEVESSRGGPRLGDTHAGVPDTSYTPTARTSSGTRWVGEACTVGARRRAAWASALRHAEKVKVCE